MKNRKIIIGLILASSLIAEDSFDFDSIETETVSAYELKNNIKIDENKNIKPISKDDFIEDSNISDIDISNQEEIILEEGESLFGSSQEIDLPTIGNGEEIIKEPLKRYSNITYVKGYDWFSILNPSEEMFNAELFKRNWSMNYFQDILNERQDIPDHIFMSALYYDYVKKEPEIAENFYLKFRDHFKERRSYKIYLSDYLIRTGRYKHMQDSIITKTDIFSYFGCKGASYTYYKGVLEYLNTRERNNTYIKKAADCGISKAKDFLK